MKLPEPERTRYELHGLLCGVPLRVRPLFWSATAVLGIRYYADPEAGSMEYFVFWMVAVPVCVLLGALAQTLTGRCSGCAAGSCFTGWAV